MINKRYTVIRKIGEGRSSVFLCHDKNYGKEVAVKILPGNATKNEIFAFKEEFLALQKITHPNIISVFDYGTILKVDNGNSSQAGLTGSKYITSEYIQGGSLLDYCLKYGLNDFDSIVVQICRTLYFLHQSNLIYFDLKYDNILVDENGGNPLVKFIDFGFVQHTRKVQENSKKGTPQYISPEILTGKKPDHRTDFYSLGIMLYRVLAGRFPFESENELDLYRKHIEEDIYLEINEISGKYRQIIKKLCSKDPEKRYSNALQIIDDLSIKADEDVLRMWEPVRSYVINNAAVDLKNFLLLSEPEYIKLIKGPNLSGKTSLAREIASNYDGVLLISPEDFQINQPQWKSLLGKILFSEYIYQYIGNFLINRILKIIQDEPANVLDEIKSVFINLSQRVKFTIIFDDFNKYDPITVQLLNELFPIFLINKVRTVVIENETLPSMVDRHSAVVEFSLPQFTEEQVSTLLSRTFNEEFPHNEISKLIYVNCDLYPGSILSFIKDLIYSQVIQFTSSGIQLSGSKEKIAKLKENQFLFYEERLNDLKEGEIELLKFLSLFDSPIPRSLLWEYFDGKGQVIDETAGTLIEKKLLTEGNNRIIQFTSAGFKNYVYSLVEDKKAEHRNCSEIIVSRKIEIDRIELARQFELGGDYDSTYSVIIAYVDEINRYEAYKYQLELLEKLSKIKLSRNQSLETFFRLSEANFKLGNLKASFAIIQKLLSRKSLDIEKREKLTLRLGECLVGMGRVNEGLSSFREQISNVTDNEIRHEIEYEIASALTYSNEVADAEKLLHKIIKENNSLPQLRGKSMNLLGIIEAHFKNNYKESIEYFTRALSIYENEGMEFKQAQVTKNMGNIYYMEGNLREAEIYWRKSLNKFLEIGNLEEEASLLNNYGILYFNNLDLEKSTDNYKKALTIYRSLGRKHGEALGYSNLAETHFMASEYDQSLLSLEKAKTYFKEIGDLNELGEIYILQGHLLKSINDNPGLARLVNEFESSGIDFKKNDLAALHLDLIKAYLLMADYNSTYSKLAKIKDDYYSLKEIGHFRRTTIVLCEYLIFNKKFPVALNILTSSDFLTSIQESPYYRAYERYLMGKISYEYRNENLKSNLEYYEDGYKILHECSISELTWKIIAALAEAYMDRGNVSKALEYIEITKSLMNHISSNIKDIRLRSLYLSTPERKATIEKLNIWENFIK